jgi:hypothetical protein
MGTCEISEKRVQLTAHLEIPAFSTSYANFEAQKLTNLKNECVND